MPPSYCAALAAEFKSLGAKSQLTLTGKELRDFATSPFFATTRDFYYYRRGAATYMSFVLFGSIVMCIMDMDGTIELYLIYYTRWSLLVLVAYLVLAAHLTRRYAQLRGELPWGASPAAGAVAAAVEAARGGTGRGGGQSVTGADFTQAFAFFLQRFSQAFVFGASFRSWLRLVHMSSAAHLRDLHVREWQERCRLALVEHSLAVSGSEDWQTMNGIVEVRERDGLVYACPSCGKRLHCLAYVHQHVGSNALVARMDEMFCMYVRRTWAPIAGTPSPASGTGAVATTRALSADGAVAMSLILGGRCCALEMISLRRQLRYPSS